MSQPSENVISVLIVADDHGLIERYSTYLRNDFEVYTASDGEDALETIDRSIDVLLLDRDISGMSGDAVLKELQERGYDLPAAMATETKPNADSGSLRFDEYLTKPVDRNSLLRTVQLLATRDSFEENSREFFRLAATKATLDADALGDQQHIGYDELQRRMTQIQGEMVDTLNRLSAEKQDTVLQTELSSTETDKLLKAIGDHTLPEDIRALIDEYQSLKSSRPLFMWKWVHRLAPQNTLPCVEEQFTDKVPNDKTIIILFITLFDDILEKRRDVRTFHEMSKIPSKHQTADPRGENVDTAYIEFAQHVWATILDRIRNTPNYDLYADLFRYDIKQAINSIEYSDLVIQRPDLATMSDLERYESHNMVLFAYADLDLMHTEPDLREDLSTLREAMWTAQLMARIGNWVSTWKRELREGDYSSGPVVYALESGLISRTELTNVCDENTDWSEELIERIEEAGIENELLRQWEQHYHQLLNYDRDLSSIDLEPFIEGTEEILHYHLASTGLK